MGGGGTTIQAPEAPRYDQATRETLQAQIDLAPPQYAAEAQFRPLYSALTAADQAFQTQQALNIARQAYPQIAAMEADYNQANRAAELGQLQTALPAYQQAFNALTPGYAQAVANAGQLAQAATEQSLNRPIFGSYLGGLNDPYGTPVAARQQQVVAVAQPGQVPTQVQQPIAPRPVAPTQGIQVDQGLSDRFVQFTQQMQQSLPGAVAAPVNPGGPIAPVRAAARGGRGLITNQEEIDAQNAKIAQYQTDLAAFNAAEPARKAASSEFLAAFNPAAAFAPRASAPAQIQGPVLPSGPLGAGGAPVSALGGPGTMTGQMQGPALPFGPQELAPRIQQAQAQPGQSMQSVLQTQQGQGSAAIIPAAQQAAYQQAFQNQQQTMQPQVSMRAPLEPNQLAAQGGAAPSSIRDTPAGSYINAVQNFTPTNVAYGAGMPQEAGYLNQVQSAQAAARTAGMVPTAANMQRVAGPQLASNIQNLDQNAVNQYIAAMPGMGQYANMLAQQSQAELSAGRSLTAEEQRMADQAARSAYAARGTALGPQAVNFEILNRADVANQRYQQRLQNAAQAAGTIQGIYQPALQQSLQRQQLGIDYGLGLQQQAFGQAQARDAMNQQLQAQRYAQAMGTQQAGFGQATTRENLNQDIQQKRYDQLMGQQRLVQSAQEQAYNQAMGREQLGTGLQQTAFNQAIQRGQAEQQAYTASTAAQAGQAALGASAMSQLQQAQAPILQAFYKQPILQGQENQAQQLALAAQQLSGPQLFNPESQTGIGSIYGAYNSKVNLATAQAQANAAAKAGQMGMFGSLGGSAIGAAGLLAFCWVAREVYGTENPRWMQFRDWMLANASDDFVDAYIQHGPKVAEFISDKPELKNMIRSWMDSKIS